MLTKLTIWFAIMGYIAGIALMVIPKRDMRDAARYVWTIGCAFFLAHVFFAFNYYYFWSHSIAYAETGRQTALVVGGNWGAGVYVGYVFTLLWSADVLWWWLSPLSHKHRPKILTVAFHTFLFFMIFNGTVVFKTGMSRLLGILLTLTLIGLWFIKRNDKNKELVKIGG